VLRAHADLLGFKPGRRQPRVLGEDARASLMAQARDEQDYARRKRAANAVDFGDMVELPLLLFQQHPDVAALWRARYRAVFLDEAQDLSERQLALVLALSQDAETFVAAGDPCQAIYGFAGSLGGEAIERLRAAFPGAEVEYLPHNLRSCALIARFSGAIVGRAPDAPKDGGLVAVVPADSEREEAELIAAEVKRAISAGVAQPGQIAVLSRARERLALVEQAMLKRRIPCHVHGRDGGLLNQPQVRDLLAHLAVGVDPSDNLALKRVASAHGLSAKAALALRGDEPLLTVEHLRDGQRIARLPHEDQAVVTRLQRILTRLKDLAELSPAEAVGRLAGPLRIDPGHASALSALAASHGSVADFLAELDAMSGDDPLAPKAEHVHLMTVHAAKGLEFEVVFLVGAEEGVLPSASADTPEALAEEQRLAYVACSRPRRALIITFARQRGGAPTESSRFLRGLPREGVRFRLPDWRALCATS